MTDPSQSRSARLSCRGHTLMEVILSTAMLCVIMGAVVSTMVIAGRAVDDNPVKQVAIAGDAANDVTTDISLAQSITESDANAVTMVVPDRDGDGQAETIRYSWSGTAGDPLMRQYNGGAEAVVASNVHRFNLSYLTTVVDGASGGDEGVPVQLGTRMKNGDVGICVRAIQPAHGLARFVGTRIAFGGDYHTDGAAPMPGELPLHQGAFRCLLKHRHDILF